MNVNETINSCILGYPLLYKDVTYVYSRAKVVDHLFFTNGNGYSWVKGELTDGYSDPLGEITKGYFGTKIFEDTTTEGYIERKKSFSSVGIETDPLEQCSYSPLNIYPICEYAKILSLPEDIKEDWLMLAEEAYDLAMDYFEDPYKHCRQSYIREWLYDRQPYKIESYLNRQRSYLKTAKAIIDERKV